MSTFSHVIYSMVMAIVPLVASLSCSYCIFRAVCCCKCNPKPILSGLLQMWIALTMIVVFSLFVIFYYYETIHYWQDLRLEFVHSSNDL